MKTILVTGGTGFIGSHTVVELQQSGYDVVIIDNLSNSLESVVNAIFEITNIKPRYYCLDICDEQKLNEFFQKEKNIDGIIHFAAYKAVGESVKLPLKYYKNNLVSLINLLDKMEEYKIKNIVFSSSCTVYGQPDILPVTETAPIKPALSPYGNTKQIAEEIISDFSINSNIQAQFLRYFNPIGAHPTAKIGELPLGVPNNLIPYITQTAIGKREMLSVYGNDYNTHDGTCVRDYIHVVDLAKAHVKSVERLINKQNKLHCEVFNLGTGKGYSVLEIINTFELVTGIKLNYKIVERRQGDVDSVYADTSFANKELGWKAELDLSVMLKSAWDWEINQK